MVLWFGSYRILNRCGNFVIEDSVNQIHQAIEPEHCIHTAQFLSTREEFLRPLLLLYERLVFVE